MINQRPFNPLRRIWFEPVATLTYIVENQPRKNINLLLVFGGIMNSLDRALEKADENTRILDRTIFAIIGGAAFGWISFYLLAYFLSIAGDWLKGKADAAAYRTVLAWSLIPSLAGAFLFIPRIIIFNEVVGQNGVFSIIDNLLQFIQFFLGVWTFVILVKGVMLIQNFSTGRALLNIFLPMLIVVGVVVFFILISKLGGVGFL